MTSSLALNPLAKSDPYQYLRGLFSWVDGFISLDSDLPEFLLKGGLLKGLDLPKMVPWWSSRKRKEIPNYELYALMMAVFQCSSIDSTRLLTSTYGNRSFVAADLQAAFLQELAQNLSRSRSGINQISFFRPLASNRFLPVLLKLLMPVFADEILLKKHDGKAQLQLIFNQGAHQFHLLNPLLSKEESRDLLVVSEKGDLPIPEVLRGELRFFPLCRFAMKESGVNLSETLKKEKAIFQRGLSAIRSGDVFLALNHMLQSTLLSSEEIEALTSLRASTPEILVEEKKASSPISEEGGSPALELLLENLVKEQVLMVVPVELQ